MTDEQIREALRELARKLRYSAKSLKPYEGSFDAMWSMMEASAEMDQLSKELKHRETLRDELRN